VLRVKAQQYFEKNQKFARDRAQKIALAKQEQEKKIIEQSKIAANSINQNFEFRDNYHEHIKERKETKHQKLEKELTPSFQPRLNATSLEMMSHREPHAYMAAAADRSKAKEPDIAQENVHPQPIGRS